MNRRINWNKTLANFGNILKKPLRYYQVLVWIIPSLLVYYLFNEPILKIFAYSISTTMIIMDIFNKYFEGHFISTYMINFLTVKPYKAIKSQIVYETPQIPQIRTSPKDTKQIEQGVIDYVNSNYETIETREMYSWRDN